MQGIEDSGWWQLYGWFLRQVEDGQISWLHRPSPEPVAARKRKRKRKVQADGCWQSEIHLLEKWTKNSKRPWKKEKEILYVFKNLDFYWLFKFHIQLWSVHKCWSSLGANKFRGTKWCELLELMTSDVAPLVEGTLTCLAGEGWREGTILLCWTRRGQGLRVCIWQSLSGLPSQVYL